MNKKRTLHTVQAVVDAFGGTKATADWADVGMSAVSNWIDREHIPPGWHYRMAKALADAGYEIDPIVFGYEEFSAQDRRDRRPAHRVA